MLKLLEITENCWRIIAIACFLEIAASLPNELDRRRLACVKSINANLI